MGVNFLYLDGWDVHSNAKIPLSSNSPTKKLKLETLKVPQSFLPRIDMMPSSWLNMLEPPHPTM